MKYGVIGIGNMASAIVYGMHKDGAFKENTLCGFDCDEAKMQKMAQEIGLVPMQSAMQVAEQADVILLAVKPQILPQVLPEIAPVLTEKKLVVTIAAGKPLVFYAGILGEKIPVVRVMPNINARVGASVSAICAGVAADERDVAVVRAMFESVGSVYELTEQQFPAFSALGGASGAFVYMYIDALASAGVKAGLPRALAQDIACHTVLGSAKLAIESDCHPIDLCDQVCSPGGTTIEGVHTLKRLGFESAVQQAIDAIIQKDHLLAK